MGKQLLLFFALMLFVWGGIVYMRWLDEDCTPSGIMTWHGKVCFNN